MSDLNHLLTDIRACSICSDFLPEGPRPILVANPHAKLLIIGQAPGRRVHSSGIPWDDPSGNRLRDWLGVTHEEFYDPKITAILPMGFCYPGTGSGGDLPPRPECAPEWHAQVLEFLPQIELTLLLSSYALKYYLKGQGRMTVTDAVKSWKEHVPSYFPLPHPSPRNNRWLKTNPWFEEEVLPVLQRHVREAVDR